MVAPKKTDKKQPNKKQQHASKPTPTTTSILHATLIDAVGTSVAVETTQGVTYRGKLEAVDPLPSLNIRLGGGVLVTLPTGEKDVAANITIPGRNQKFIQLAESMKFAPRFSTARKGLVGGASSSSNNNNKGETKKKPLVAKWGSKHNALNKKKAKKEITNKK